MNVVCTEIHLCRFPALTQWQAPVYGWSFCSERQEHRCCSTVGPKYPGHVGTCPGPGPSLVHRNINPRTPPSVTAVLPVPRMVHSRAEQWSNQWMGFLDKGSFINSPDYQALCQVVGIQRMRCNASPPECHLLGAGVAGETGWRRAGTQSLWSRAAPHYSTGFDRGGDEDLCPQGDGWGDRRGFRWGAAMVVPSSSTPRVMQTWVPAPDRGAALCCDLRGYKI